MKKLIYILSILFAFSLQGQNCELKGDAGELCNCAGASHNDEADRKFERLFLASPIDERESSSVETPIITEVLQHFPMSFSFRFEAGKADGFTYYIYQGDKRLIAKALRGDRSTTSYLSAEDLQLTDYDTPLTVQIKARYKGKESKKGSIEVMPIKRKPLAHKSYEFQYRWNREYGIDGRTGDRTEGWTQAEINELEPKVKYIIKWLEKAYGNPASDLPFVFTKFENSSKAYKIPAYGELRFSKDIDIRLLGHELDHAWWCPTNLTVDANWKYDSANSFLEESRAEYIGRQIANEYNWNGHLYDYYNTSAIRANEFFFADGAMNEQYVQYGIGAEAVKKMEYSIPDIISNFYEIVCTSLTRNPETITKDWIRYKLIEASEGERVEGMGFADWYDAQHIFDGGVFEGERIYQTIDYTSINDLETLCENRFYLIDVFDNGNAWESDDGQKYNKNGEIGHIRVTKHSGEVVFDEDLQITPIEHKRKIGKVRITLSSADEENSFTSRRSNFDDHHIIFVEPELNLYKIEVEFGENTLKTYRIFGNIDDESDLILVGVPNVRNGTLWTTGDDGFDLENGVAVVNNFEGGELATNFGTRILPTSKYTQHVIFEGQKAPTEETPTETTPEEGCENEVILKELRRLINKFEN